jgi:prepilin-type N-terminal cleavage/methylation domain-containing protein
MHTQPTNATPVQGPSARRGFSLIELVLVMTIISILAAIAVPRYANALARYRADAAARRIITDLAYARQLAKSSSARLDVNIKPDLDQVHISGVPNPDGNGDWLTHLSRGPYYADITGVSFNGDTTVKFDGYGAPNYGGKIILRVGSETRTITLSADTGKAVMQ